MGQESISKIWWGVLITALVVVSGAFLRDVRVHRPGESDLPVLGSAPDFLLKDQANHSFSSKSLAGKTWVADFIYTACPGQCPVMTQKMARIQGLLPGESTVQLVSISVDPAQDSPAALDRYARRFHADPARWHFLTGTPSDLQTVLQGFKVSAPAAAPNVPERPHSNRLILVDAAARIRGYYNGTDDGEVQRLVKDLSALSGAAN